MGKASSSKKVARAARAGGNRRSGQRRHLGFPVTIFAVIVLGLALVLVTRRDRIANASPRPNSDHWHVPYSVYTCVPDPSTPVTTTTTSSTVPGETTTTTAPGITTTTTAPGATTTTVPGATTTTVPGDTTTTSGPSTTIALAGDVPGQFQAPFQDATTDVNGIHTHGDGVIHVHPFNTSSAGRNANLSVFMAQVGVTLTDEELSFPDPSGAGTITFKEGVTKCQGGKDGQVQVGVWDKATDAAAGKPPNRVVTSNVSGVHLVNDEALTIAFMPSGSRIPIEPDVQKRFENLTDVSGVTTTTVPGETTTTAPGATTTTVPGATTTTAPAATTTTVASSTN